MKNILNITISVLCVLVLGVSCKKETQEKALVLNPEMVVVGEELSISYDASKTNLAGKDNIDAVAYYWQNYHWIAQDVDLEQKRGLWKGTVQFPDGASIVALKFVAGDEYDSGSGNGSGANTYVQFTVDKDKENLPSAYIGWALLRAPGMEKYSIPNYVCDSAKIDTKQIFFYWMNTELKLFPEERKNVGYIAAEAININKKAVGNQIIKDDINLILSLDSANQATDMDLYHAIEMANLYEPNGPLANQIKALSEKKFPDGIVTRDKEILRIFRLSDPKEKEEAMAAFVKRFPYKKWKNIDTFNSDLYLGKNFQSVIYNQIIKHNNYQLAEDYLHEVPYYNLFSSFRHMIQIPYAKELRSAKDLLPIAKMLMGEIYNRERTLKDLVYSDREWYNNILEQQKDLILDYAIILNETGSTEDALNWVQKVEPYFDGSSTIFSDFYITLLDKTGQSDKVEDVILKGIAANTISPEMIDRLKSIYIKKNGSEEGFDAYFQKLKPLSEIEKHQAEIKASFINKDIELYSYETMDGDTLNMADQKGKILILDFWATWCGPCKAAMPGMNMAYQDYKDDEGVEFFFISTMEFNKNYKTQIQKFLKDKDYEFTVLLDMMNPETHKGDYAYSQYVKAFGFTGIPQKIIIDSKGKLRWRSIGYNGSPSALADEISFIIEELKKEI